MSIKRSPAHQPRQFRRTSLAASVVLALSALPAMGTYLVTNTLDNGGINPAPDAGTGTLRQAIVDAVYHCFNAPVELFPSINFNIPGTGPFVIALAAPLPQLSCNGVAFNPSVNGHTQPGFVFNTSPSGYNGSIQVAIDGSAVMGLFSCGLDYRDFGYGGQGSITGLEIRNFSYGGNSSGVCGYKVKLEGNHIYGNSYGVNADGQIGDGGATARNFIYGNSVAGIQAAYGGPVDILGNYIGIEGGLNPVSNGSGIFVQTTQPVTISGNVIAGNTGGTGIYIYDQDDFTIIDNKIGTGPGLEYLPNNIGISVNNFSNPAPAANIKQNTIYYNNTGVRVNSGAGIRISENAIQYSANKNIDLDMYGGAVPNDVGDPDGGSNNRQNYPEIASVVQAGGNTTVVFSLDSLPGAYNVEFFDNPSPMNPGGATFRGNTSITVVTAGTPVGGSFTIGAITNHISVTATSAAGDTSEFSPIVSWFGTPAVTPSTTTMNFGNVGIGSTSGPLTATLTSTGTADWQLYYMGSPSCYGGAVCYGGAEFICATNCGGLPPQSMGPKVFTSGVYPPGQGCQLNVSFAPTFTGPQSTTVQFCGNTSPVTITISGNGVIPPPISLSPPSNDFGTVPVGSSAGPVLFTVSNPTASPLAIGVPLTSGPFSLGTTTCGAAIPANESCNINVFFNPDASGPLSGQLVVAPAGGTAVTATLTGTGSVRGELLLPALLEFSRVVGTTAPSEQTVELKNSGLAPLSFSSITITGAQFTLAHDCPTTLAPGASCRAVVRFTATDTGLYLGQLTVVSDAPGGSAVIALRGNAQPRPVPTLEVTPRDIGFGTRGFGAVSPGEKITVKNIGGATALFTSFTVSPDFVILSNNCGGALPSLATCEAQVAMRPIGYGTRSGNFTVNSNADNNPVSTFLFGTGCRLSGMSILRLGQITGC